MTLNIMCIYLCVCVCVSNGIRNLIEDFLCRGFLGAENKRHRGHSVLYCLPMSTLLYSSQPNRGSPVKKLIGNRGANHFNSPLSKFLT